MRRELKSHRGMRLLSQWDLAVQAGISRSRYQLIEQGRMDPTDDEKRSIAAVLDAPVHKLFPSREAVAS